MERQRLRNAIALGIALALLLTMAPAASAQSGKEVGQALCSALKAGEVAEEMGVKMDASRDLYACTWGTRSLADPERYLNLGWLPLSFEELQAAAPDLEAVTVGGRDALYDPNQPSLAIDLDQGVLVLSVQWLSGDIDWRPALSQLGELAVGRAGDLVAPPPVDPALAALYPALAGEEWDLTPAYVDETFSGEFEPGKALRRALKREGFGLADVSLIEGVARPSLVGLYALRVPGADAAAFGSPATAWLMGVGWTAEPEEYVNGVLNEITHATGGPPAYVYPKDDVVWVVNAEEPQLSQLLAALPGAPTLPGEEVPAEEVPAEEVPQEEPADDATSDGSVADLLPTSLGGEELIVQTLEGSSGSGFNDPKSRTYKALTAGLESQGKTVDDITIATAGDSAGTFGILGIEVDGADASAFVDFAIETILAGLPSRKHTKEAAEVAGKAVTIVRPQQAMGQVFHVYPQGDIVWVVGGPDDMLQEILEALP